MSEEVFNSSVENQEAQGVNPQVDTLAENLNATTLSDDSTQNISLPCEFIAFKSNDNSFFYQVAQNQEINEENVPYGQAVEQESCPTENQRK